MNKDKIYEVKFNYCDESRGSVLVYASNETDAYNIAKAMRCGNEDIMYNVSVVERTIYKEFDVSGDWERGFGKAVVHWDTGELKVFNDNESARLYVEESDVDYYDFSKKTILKKNNEIGKLYGINTIKPQEIRTLIS